MSSKEVAEQLLLQEYKTIINDKFATTVWETGSLATKSATTVTITYSEAKRHAIYIGPYAIVLFKHPHNGFTVQLYALSKQFLSKMTSQKKYQQIHPIDENVIHETNHVIHLENYNLERQIALPYGATDAFNKNRLSKWLDSIEI